VAVPILIPPLLIRIPDAVWVSTLVLLTLRASFLLPPVGYALMMTRGLLGSEVPLAMIARSLVPFLAVEALVVGLTLSFSSAVHLLEAPGARSRHTVGPALSKEDVEKKLLEMLRPPSLPEVER
jgi:TRAP-type mannitol/chloroaromatic compound transport system permease large subunit